MRGVLVEEEEVIELCRRWLENVCGTENAIDLSPRVVSMVTSNAVRYMVIVVIVVLSALEVCGTESFVV